VSRKIIVVGSLTLAERCGLRKSKNMVRKSLRFKEHAYMADLVFLTGCMEAAEQECAG
jgi:hypothetical protein